MGYAFFTVVFLFAALLIPFSSEAFTGASNGLELFLTNVFPALFPFLVCSHCIIEYGLQKKLCRIPYKLKCPLYAFICAVCGTPSAALTVKAEYDLGDISANRASILCAVCNTSGPIFIISTLSAGFFGDIRYAVIFAISHYVPSFIAAAAIGLRLDRVYPVRTLPNPNTVENCNTHALFVLPKAISASVTDMLRVGGTIVFFRVVHSVLIERLPTDLAGVPVNALLTGMLEMTNGLELLASDTGLLTLSLAAFLLSFGGLCIFIQSKLIFDKLSARVYLLAKLIMGMVSALFALAVFPLIPIEAAVFSAAGEPLNDALRGAPQKAITLAGPLVPALLSIAVIAVFSTLIKKRERP